MDNENRIENEDEYRPLKVTPAMAQYLRDVAEGREELIGPFNSLAEMWEDTLGENWRDAFEDAEAVEKCKI